MLYGGIIVHFAIKNSAFIKSIKKDLLLILLYLMFRAKNILKILSTINRNKIKALIALLLCLYTWFPFQKETASLKHLFSICQRLWHIDTTFFKPTTLGRLVTHNQSAFSSIVSHPPSLSEWRLTVFVSLDLITLTGLLYESHIFSIVLS